MDIKVDIRGRTNQWDTRSILGFASDEDPNFNYIVEIETKHKQKLKQKHGHITDFPEKFHCILIVYALQNHFNKITSIQFCNDIGAKKLMKYVKDYLGNLKAYNNIPKSVRSVGKKSTIHKLLVQVGKKKRKPDLKITSSMILKYL